MYLNNISILIFDYPGFGKSEGIPNEENCILCSLQFYNFLIHQKKYPPENIILYGESIGGCIASSLSQQIISPKLILQSTFSNIQNIIKKISNLPTFLYMSIGFNTKKNLQKRNKLKRINSNLKTLIIHSEEDELIPFEHALELSKYSTHFYTCKGNHNSTQINKEFIENIILFILEK